MSVVFDEDIELSIGALDRFYVFESCETSTEVILHSIYFLASAQACKAFCPYQHPPKALHTKIPSPKSMIMSNTM